MTRSRGAAELIRWLERERRSQEWLASQIGVHQTSVSLWLRGGEPRVKHALKLREATGIEPQAWAERERAPRKKAA